MRKVSVGSLAVAVALALVGFATVVQARDVRHDDEFSSLRRQELVGLLDDLDQQAARLSDDVAKLTKTRDDLRSGADRARVAQQDAAEQLTALQILAGSLPAHGPGVRIVIADPNQQLSPAILIDALQEMRDAGGEAMEFNDEVRVVAQTWVSQTSGSLIVDGRPISRPVTLEVVGDPATLEQAARFRGGLVSQVESERVGGRVSIERLDDVTISSVRTHTPPRHARPI